MAPKRRFSTAERNVRWVFSKHFSMIRRCENLRLGSIKGAYNMSWRNIFRRSNIKQRRAGFRIATGPRYDTQNEDFGSMSETFDASVRSTFQDFDRHIIVISSSCDSWQLYAPDEMWIFEALFKGVSTRFGPRTIEKYLENPHLIICSSFQNLRLGSIQFARNHNMHYRKPNRSVCDSCLL